MDVSGDDLRRSREHTDEVEEGASHVATRQGEDRVIEISTVNMLSTRAYAAYGKTSHNALKG
jgi:hypothetical protein